MDAEKEQADSLCITMVHSYASLETNFVQPNTVTRAACIVTIFHDSVSQWNESYERNNKINDKPWSSLKNVVYRCSILSDAFLKIVLFRYVIIFLDETGES